MSFMSFDYAMRAADAALQFQQSQGQNIKDTNARVREVGTGNAKRKDDLVRQTIEAEYEAKSADIKKDKASRLAQLAKERKDTAVLAQWAVGLGTLAGGMIDGLMGLGDKKGVAPQSEQMGISNKMIEDGYATSFRMTNGTGNSEQGAMVAFDTNKGTFNMVSMNTTSGEVNGFVQMSATEMAQRVLDSTADNPQFANLRSMIDQGPPPMFKAGHFNQQPDGSVTMSDALKTELFGGGPGNAAGFFASGARVGAPAHSPAAAGEVWNRVKQMGNSPEANNMRGMMNPPQEARFKPEFVQDPRLNATMERLGLPKPCSAQDAYEKLRGNDSADARLVLAMIQPPVPASFKDEALTKDSEGKVTGMGPGLQQAMQSPQFSDIVQNAGKPVGDESGELMIAGLLRDPAPMSMAYGPTAENILSMLGNKQMQNGLQINDAVVDKGRKALDESGALNYSTGVGEGFNKVLFKPLGNALQPFMELAKVAKQYEEEYNAKMAEYEAAKKQAAVAREKLQKLQALLAMGSSG